jgi:hypothetical protein
MAVVARSQRVRINLQYRNPFPFAPGVDKDEVRAWIIDRLNAARRKFRRHMVKPAPSAPYDYPSNRTGKMSRGVMPPRLYGLTGRVDMVTLPKNYVKYHKTGTELMAPRKLVYDALQELLIKHPKRRELAQAAKWKYGR